MAKKGKKGRRRLPNVFFQMAEELGLQDIWRETNTKSSQFTFYSNRHKSWSRIDMIWLSSELKTEIQEVEIETNIWADHNPMKMWWKGERKDKMDFKSGNFEG